MSTAQFPVGVEADRGREHQHLGRILRGPVFEIWLAVMFFAFSYLWFSIGVSDWSRDIAPSARLWRDAPWTHGLPQAPWLALLLYPFSVLPDRLAMALMAGISVLVFATLIRRYGGPRWLIVPILISPFAWWYFSNGQTEWLILLGLFLGNGWEAIFLAAKPQVAIGALLFRIKSWRFLLPGLVVGLASLVIWGLWPLEIARQYSAVLIYGGWNSTLFPWSIPVGIAFLYVGYKKRDERFGIAATPLLFPYVNIQSYLGLLIALGSKWPRVLLILWILYLVASTLFVSLATSPVDRAWRVQLVLGIHG